jgi:hypothetical protein
VGAAVDEQGCQAHWETLWTGFRVEFVCDLCARIGGDDLPEELGGGAAAGAAQHVRPPLTINMFRIGHIGCVGGPLKWSTGCNRGFWRNRCHRRTSSTERLASPRTGS